jgi:anti-anti-sigma factor
MLRIDIHSSQNAATLVCSGRLTFGVETETLRTMAQTRREEELRLDLSRIDRIDAAGLGLLVELQAWARENHRRLTFLELSEEVWRLIIITKLFDALEISCDGVPAHSRESASFDRNEMIA